MTSACKVALLYAKSQTVRGRAANAYAEEDTTKGEYSRDEIYPPLGILTLAAVLEERGGYDVRILDDCIQPLDEIKDGMAWADVVGISSLTPNASRARELGLIAKNEIGRFVVMGGPHPTTNPEYFLNAGAADICVQGEGDRTLPEILEHYTDRSTWRDIAGMTFKDGDEIVENPRRELVSDVNELPFPAYHLGDMERYFAGMVTPGINIMTSRGCPFSCTFCDANMTPRQYRAMKPERAVDLIESLLRTYNPPQIFFFDDLFTIQRKRVVSICKEIVNRGLHFEWSCESRVDTVDAEMLRWMRKAGCVKIYFGLESGSPNMLQTMKKDVTPEKIQAGAKLTREIGIFFKFFILYGFPNDTVEDHRLTEQLVANCRPDAISVSILVPIPGTEIFEEIKPHLLVDVTEREFHFWHHDEFWKHPTFTHDEMVAERDRLIQSHAKVVKTPLYRLGRRLERMWAVARNPALFTDYFEIRKRKSQHNARVKQGGWNEPRKGAVDLQIPSASWLGK